jgi:hypothetical protein
MRLGRVQGLRQRESADRTEIVGLITGAIEADRLVAGAGLVG